MMRCNSQCHPRSHLLVTMRKTQKNYLGLAFPHRPNFISYSLSCPDGASVKVVSTHSTELQLYAFPITGVVVPSGSPLISKQLEGAAFG